MSALVRTRPHHDRPGQLVVAVIKTRDDPHPPRAMSEHIDMRITGALTREQAIDEAGDAPMAMIVRTANGRLTAAEAAGRWEFPMTKLYRGA